MNGFASISLERRIEWIDTDAAGIYHWSTACRLVEAAEAEMHRSIGITELTFGVSPRLHVDFDFKKRLRFDDRVRVELAVTSLGRSSITYEVEIHGPGGVAITGSMVTCIVERGADGNPQAGRAVPLSPRLRQALAESGPIAVEGR